MNIETTTNENIFIDAYFEAITFTEFGDIGQPQLSEPLDADFIRESVIDCLAFYSRARSYLSDDNIGQAGYDFWMTRQGHGTGFWDRSEMYGEYPSEYLTKVANSFGEVNAQFEDVL